MVVIVHGRSRCESGPVVFLLWGFRAHADSKDVDIVSAAENAGLSIASGFRGFKGWVMDAGLASAFRVQGVQGWVVAKWIMCYLPVGLTLNPTSLTRVKP